MLIILELLHTIRVNGAKFSILQSVLNSLNRLLFVNASANEVTTFLTSALFPCSTTSSFSSNELGLRRTAVKAVHPAVVTLGNLPKRSPLSLRLFVRDTLKTSSA